MNSRVFSCLLLVVAILAAINFILVLEYRPVETDIERRTITDIPIWSDEAEIGAKHMPPTTSALVFSGAQFVINTSEPSDMVTITTDGRIEAICRDDSAETMISCEWLSAGFVELICDQCREDTALDAPVFYITPEEFEALTINPDETITGPEARITMTIDEIQAIVREIGNLERQVESLKQINTEYQDKPLFLKFRRKATRYEIHSQSDPMLYDLILNFPNKLIEEQIDRRQKRIDELSATLEPLTGGSDDGSN